MEVQLFPDVPEALAALSDEELRDLLAEFQAKSKALAAGEIDLEETFPELNRAEASAAVMEQWRAAAIVAQELRAALTERTEREAAFDAEAAEIHAQFGEEENEEAAPAADDEAAAEAAVEGTEGETLADENDEDDNGEEKDEDEEKDEEPEGTQASGNSASTRVVPLYPAVARRHQPEGESARGMVITAGGNAGVLPGREVDRIGYAEQLIEVARRRGPVQRRRDGGEERILIASATQPLDESRHLRVKDPDGNSAKMRAVGSPYYREGRDALLASGGLCAPATPLYDLPQFAVTSRPIRDALPSFTADRGAVSVPSVDYIGDVMAESPNSITVIEESADAAGGTFATKSCADFECETWTDVAVGIISHCRSFGNLVGRTWPEGVAHQNDLTMAAHARTAEGRLLDRIDANSLALSGGAIYGAASTLLYRLTLSRAGIISRLRMDPASTFRVILPFWATHMFSMDIVNSQFERFGVTPEGVGALLGRYGFSPIWHLDQGVAGGADTEVWPAEAAGTQDDWPGTNLIARVYPEGHFVYLDGGTLELGLVRDSSLNETNDYQLFGETFENLYALGPTQAAHRLELTICPNGLVAAPETTEITCA